MLEFLQMLCEIGAHYPGFETDIHGAYRQADGRYTVKVLKKYERKLPKVACRFLFTQQGDFMKTPSQPRAIFTSWRFKFENTSAFTACVPYSSFILPTSLV